MSHWNIGSTLANWLKAVTKHYSLHAPEHVGAFAGSYLERQDWDHQ